MAWRKVFCLSAATAVCALSGCSGSDGGGGGTPTSPSSFTISAAGITIVFHQETVTITASGCSSVVQWSAPDGAPSTGQGNTFEVFWWPGFGENTATVTATCGTEQRSVDVDVVYRAAICDPVEIQASFCEARLESGGFRNGTDEPIAVLHNSFIRRGDGGIQKLGETRPSSVPSIFAHSPHAQGVAIDPTGDPDQCNFGGSRTIPIDDSCVEASGVIFSFYPLVPGTSSVDYASGKLRPDQVFEGNEYKHIIICATSCPFL